MNKIKLSHEDKVRIISALLSGLANDAIFDEDTIRERIKVCLDIAEEFL
jgi:hypothetical protein